MRRGLNRIELGIVLVILAALVAALLPAVQKVREAAARAKCRNNLKQIALAAHAYHDTNTRFPHGTMPNPELTVEQRLSFLVAIYPYVEASNLYSRFAKAEPWDSPTNSVLAEVAPVVYHCPAWGRGPKDSPSPFGHLPVTNYVGVAGVGADAATRPPDAPGNGVFGYDRATKQEDVKDGLENTALLVETARDVGPWVRGGPSTVRAAEADNPRFGGTHIRQTWAFQKRADGFNVALADASVRFTKRDIAPEVLAALATVAGGEEIPANW